jgi:hypothetical protein
LQGGGEKRELFSEKTEKTRRKRKIKVFCSFLRNFPYKKGEKFSLRKLRKPGEREIEKVVLLFSSTLGSRICTLQTNLGSIQLAVVISDNLIVGTWLFTR